MRSPRFFYFAIAGIVLLAATSVFADGREISYAERVQELRRETASSVITGSLICQMAERNDGSPCEIRLKETATGVVYQLENTGSVRRMFQEGIREVAVTGSRTGDTVFSVTSAAAR